MKLVQTIKYLPILAAALFFSQGAQAVTPANALLTNTAKLVYDGNATGIEATVNVRVTLVTANVTIATAFNPPQDQTKAENQAFSSTYNVYAQNNGLDSYAITNSAVTPTNVTGTGTFSYTPTTIELGATALSVLSTNTTTFTVPSDGDGAGTYGTPDATINGLIVGDKVIIGTGTVVYTITAISDPGTGNATVTVDTAIPASLAIGTGVFETKSFTIQTSDVGALSATTGNVVVTTSISNGVDAAFTDDIQINIVQINFDKYVRCISSCDESSGTGAFDYDKTDNTTDGGGNNYFTGGVTAEPAGVLEYLLVVENPTLTQITNAVLSDTLPAFTSYQSNTTLLNTLAVSDEGGFPLDSTTADNGGLEVGDSGSLTGGEDDGTIGASTTIYIVYQVQVGS